MSRLLYYEPYRPSQVQIDSIGIGIFENTLTTLNLYNTEYLMVGEKTVNTQNDGSNTIHNLIVDSTGVAINTSLGRRRERRTNQEHSLVVEGSTYVNGVLYVRDIDCSNLNVRGSTNSLGTGASFSYWRPTSDFPQPDIWYDGRLTIGTDESTFGNRHHFSIVRGTYLCRTDEARSFAWVCMEWRVNLP
jgi:hypothetical protein